MPELDTEIGVCQHLRDLQRVREHLNRVYLLAHRQHRAWLRRCVVVFVAGVVVGALV